MFYLNLFFTIVSDLISSLCREPPTFQIFARPCKRAFYTMGISKKPIPWASYNSSLMVTSMTP